LNYTVKQLEALLGELMMAAWSGEQVIILRDGKPIAELVHRGPGFKLQSAGRLGATISYKKTAPIRSHELSDLGFEE
jgi:antitoxin (DNA-binding transcriptional repressor) of toxin-antitoxin stability system